jgi:hypothetical protein
MARAKLYHERRSQNRRSSVSDRRGSAADRRTMPDRREGFPGSAEDHIQRAIAEFHTYLEHRLSGRAMTNSGTPDKQTIFVLKKNNQVLDIYRTANAAFTAAEDLRRQGEVVWKQSRPGRWWSVDGALEVEEWQLK